MDGRCGEAGEAGRQGAKGEEERVSRGPSPCLAVLSAAALAMLSKAQTRAGCASPESFGRTPAHAHARRSCEASSARSVSATT